MQEIHHNPDQPQPLEGAEGVEVTYKIEDMDQLRFKEFEAERIRQGKEKKHKNDKLRAEIVQRFAQGSMTIDEIITLAQQEEFKPLQRIKALRLLSNIQGWNGLRARRAFNTYGLSENIRVSTFFRSQNALESFKILVESSPDAYRPRIVAPQGWPWRANVLGAIKDLEQEHLPRPVRDAVRFVYEKEKFLDAKDIAEQNAFDPDQDLVSGDSVYERDAVGTYTPDVFYDDDDTEEEFDSTQDSSDALDDLLDQVFEDEDEDDDDFDDGFDDDFDDLDSPAFSSDLLNLLGEEDDD